MEKSVVDTVMWGVLTASAALLSGANQDWASGHGRLVGLAAVLACVGAGLKTFPIYTKAKAATVAATLEQEAKS